jgi:hypothetical protein
VDEERFEVTTLERSVLIWMRVPEFRQVVQKELPEALGDVMLLLDQLAQLDHLRMVNSHGLGQCSGMTLSGALAACERLAARGVELGRLLRRPSVRRTGSL